MNTDPIIDCDIHPTVPSTDVLLPYMDEYWRQSIGARGVDLTSIAYPPNAPISARPEWRGTSGRAGLTAEAVSDQLLDRWDIGIAICNCLYGVQMVHNDDMAAAFAKAVNDWVKAEWLDRDPRLRGSIVVSTRNVEFAVDEIDRCAADRRFVQVLFPAMNEIPLGRRQLWPIYAAAERHGLAIGIHAGSSYHHPVTSTGWPTYLLEDYVCQSQGVQAQVASLICEGVLREYPGLKFVLMESGVTWAPAFIWRLSKFWRGLRTEVPWVDRAPTDLFRDHFRLTLQPFDAPDDPGIVQRTIDQFQSEDILLFSSDYPHWQFDGDEIVPPGISAALLERMQRINPVTTYSRLTEQPQ